MALIRDYELPGTGLTVSNAYHVVTKVDVEKRMQNVEGPVDTTRPDGLTPGSQEEGKEVYWKAGYVGTIAVTVWKDAGSRVSGSRPLGFIGVNPTDNAYGANIGTEGMDHICKFFLDNSLTSSYTEQAYKHLLTTEYYSGSAISD
jgi:hypothetical protein